MGEKMLPQKGGADAAKDDFDLGVDLLGNARNFNVSSGVSWIRCQFNISTS